MKNRALKIAAVVLLFWSSLFSSYLWAETATATDQDIEEVIVAREILNKQKEATPSQTAAAEAQVQQPNIANDMAEGQTQRDLPSLNAPVIDQANLLTATEKQQISQRILNLHNAGKGQVGVVIVPTTGQEDIFGYSMRVAEAWGLGSAKRDNGLLMTIAINDRRIQILTGYGLEGVIPDIVASRIINDKITPYFKQAQYAQGIDAGLAEIERILTLDPEIAAQAADELKERQEQAYQSHKATQSTLSSVLFIVVAGVIASFIFGKKLSASTAAVAGTAAGLVNGMGLVASLLIGAGVFFLLVTSIAQLIFQAFLSGGGRGGGSGRGGFGGGFGGGGGGFGGGGASGSW
ncbi:TPM domain-containing protein [Acinetobacter wanghuae]|uniref:TPM domain-containing protein n=1 Tax=Acinetobacter wanghuae TaxID=2662362 RepID=A0A5Q0P780_9GAMM|nr:TPM domain-containing protein [Acinetobacter wanghuae]MQW92860.1 TPM domain-containing protein [Acinetobacter wanghuae]QGA12001.1 TPM domain-containing protein [Acinetobacter wanghuae]